ncbi:MAG: shikimate kinase [Sporolactobacillus sp.]|jgi:shikimate kinase|nr:shikimate kinase [Sporolactobacillus sp.]
MAKVILIGFMGSGKTTVGKRLADRLGCPHLDLDELIVRTSGQSISRIFAEHGESGFRELETQSLAAALTKRGILSTGGGTPVREENRRMLIHTDVPVVLLKTAPGVILERLKRDGTRPLLETLDRSQFIALYRKRLGFYHQVADVQIVTDEKSPDEVVAEIIRRIDPALSPRRQ